MDSLSVVAVGGGLGVAYGLVASCRKYRELRDKTFTPYKEMAEALTQTSENECPGTGRYVQQQVKHAELSVKKMIAVNILASGMTGSFLAVCGVAVAKSAQYSWRYLSSLAEGESFCSSNEELAWFTLSLVGVVLACASCSTGRIANNRLPTLTTGPDGGRVKSE